MLASERVSALLNLPPLNDRFCTAGGLPVHMESVSTPGKNRVTRFACKSWRCRLCADYLRHRAGNHFAEMLLRAARLSLLALGIGFNVGNGPYARMRRNQAEWVRVGTLLIWCVACEEIDDNAFSDTSVAIATLGTELRTLVAPPAVRGVSDSDQSTVRIGFGANQRRPKSSGRIGWLTIIEPDVLVEALQKLGVTGVKIRRTSGFRCSNCGILFGTRNRTNNTPIGEILHQDKMSELTLL